MNSFLIFETVTAPGNGKNTFLPLDWSVSIHVTSLITGAGPITSWGRWSPMKRAGRSVHRAKVRRWGTTWIQLGRSNASLPSEVGADRAIKETTESWAEPSGGGLSWGWDRQPGL